MTGRPTKDELRARFAAARTAMGGADRERARASIRAAVLERCRERSWTCVAAYVPWASEPGSVELLDDLDAAGVRVLVPVTLPDRELDWVAWPQQGGGLGLDAVAGSDAVLVPALAVATDGTRLGRGRGCYDRALRRCPDTTETAALIFDHEAVEALPSDPWDVPVQARVTPSGWTGTARNTAGRPGD